MSNKIEAICVLNQNNIKGTIIFNEISITKNNKKKNLTKINIKIKGLKEGLHGIHIHECGDLRDGCTSLCAHYNPHNKNHGGPNDKDRHVGDLGNIKANKNGIVNSIIIDNLVKLKGKYSVIGRSIVIHENEDDLGKGDNIESKKTGNAGKRICCGIIGYSKNNKNI